ncbi:MAG: HDOD domain-containing protein [Serpentinimonas sp.]|nr:HDOD domain-containing protein [Serpentinimonas sp.]
MSSPTTPSVRSAPLGLAAWRKRLAAVRLPLVSPPDVLQALQDPDLPSPRLLEALNRDLPLGLAVMREAQRVLPQGQRVSNLAHALGVLGLTRLYKLIDTLGQQRLDPGQAGHLHLAEALQTSRLAGHLALQFAQIEPGNDGLARMGAVQAQNVAEWLLPLAAPALVEEMMQRVQDNERPGRVEQELLGCTLQQLSAAVAVDIGLFESDSATLLHALEPALLGRAARLAWVGTNPPEIPTDLGRWLYRPSTLPSLLQMLAHELMHDWHSRRSSVLLKAIATHRHLKLDEVLAATRRAAIQASLEPHLWAFCAAPATRLLWPPKPRLRRVRAAAVAVAVAAPESAQQPAPAAQAAALAAPAAATRAAPRPAPAPAPRPKPAPERPSSVEPGSRARTLIDLFVDDCRSGRHADLSTFFRAFKRSLADGLGLERYALFLKMSQGEQLVCFLARGFGPEIEPRRYSLALDGHNLIAKLFAQPNGFYMAERARVAGLRALLPEKLRPELLASGALWGAVHVNQRSVGVLWADCGPEGGDLDAVQYAGFKLLVRHFGEELTRLMRVQKSQTVFADSSRR